MTTDATTEVARDLHGASIIASVPFLPVTAWAELEEARVRHERALAEVADARREEALINGRHKAQQAQELQAAAGRVLDGEAPVDLAAGEDVRRRELDAISMRLQAAMLARRDAVIAALRVIEQHPGWLKEIAGRRVAAEAERAELLDRAEAARVRAHSEQHLESWLLKAATHTCPQPYREAGPPPPPPATVQQVFGHARAS